MRTVSIQWTAEMDALLGTDTDKRIAAVLGLGTTTVYKRRVAMKIPAFVQGASRGRRPRKALTFHHVYDYKRAEKARQSERFLQLPILQGEAEPLEQVEALRPRTRLDCLDGLRPCPFVSCQYHLLAEVTRAGSLMIRHPEIASLDQLAHTCALDMADQGPQTLEAIGEALNTTREAVRMFEAAAIEKLKRAGAAQLLEHLEPDAPDLRYSRSPKLRALRGAA